MNRFDTELVYQIEGSNSSRLVVVEASAHNLMRQYRQVGSSDHESGGVLIGERRGKSFVVKEITTPSTIDKSARYSFTRKSYHHQTAVNMSNQLSGGTSNYIGEWHTHPQDNPYPSSVDFENWSASLCEPCLVAEVGRMREWWGLYENETFYTLLLLNEG